MKIITKTILIMLTLLISLSIKTIAATNGNTLHEKKAQYSKYLFAYFPSNSNENIYYALSDDGFKYTPMNGGNRVVAADSIAIKKGLRDPHLLRGNDGWFYMVATDMKSAEGWSSNRGLVLMRSKDLVNWTHSTVHFPAKYAGTNFANVTRVWAPETIWDEQAGKYMIYFSLLTSDGTIPYDKVFYCYANKDFTDLEGEPTVLFDLGMSAIDMDIVFNPEDNLYHGFFKNEEKGGILKVTAKTLTAPEGTKPGSQWGNQSGRLQQTNVAVEGAGVFQLIDGKTWVLMYDCYGSGYYQFCTSTDLLNFKLAAQTTTNGIFTPRHGSVILLTDEEVRSIEQAFNSKESEKARAELKNETERARLLGVDVTAALALLANPDATSAEITEMGIQLKNAEFQYVTDTYNKDVTSQFVSNRWTEAGGTATNRGQHWDGTASSTYLEQSGSNWGASAWNVSFKQTLTLPAGSYVVKVAGRSSSDVKASLSIAGNKVEFPSLGDTGYGIDTSGATNFSSEGTYANNNKGRGWEWRYIPFVVTEEGTYELKLEASTSTSHQWVSFTSVTLLKSTYDRTILGKGWGTICLPNAAFPEEGVKAYTVAGRSEDNKTLFFNEKTGKMEAGVPYVFLGTNEVASFNNILDEKVEEPVEGDNQLIGVFKALGNEFTNGIYILYDDEWRQVTSSQSFNVGANHAYIRNLEGIPVVTSADTQMTIHENDENAVRFIDVKENSVKDVSYTIGGTRATDDTHGIIISNGYKTIK